MFDLALTARLTFRHQTPTKPPLPPGRYDLGARTISTIPALQQGLLAAPAR